MTREEKIVKTIALYDNEILKITDSIENWKNFLSKSSDFYKHNFSDQLLIMAQRPNATAVAVFDVWDKDMHRHIKKGAKGIPVLHNGKNGLKKLDYLYDVSDTSSRNETSRTPNIWKMKIDYSEEINKRLSSKYNIKSDNLEDFIEKMISKQVSENYKKFTNSIIKNKNNTPLEELDNHTIETEFRFLMETSAKYAVFSRCGFDTSHFEDDLFRSIGNFNTKEVIAQLGNAINGVNKSVLREIERETRSIDKVLNENQITFSDIERRNNYERELQRGRNGFNGLDDSSLGKSVTVSGKTSTENGTVDRGLEVGKSENRFDGGDIRQGGETVFSEVERGTGFDVRTGRGNNDISSVDGTSRTDDIRYRDVGKIQGEISERGTSGNIRGYASTLHASETLGTDGQSSNGNGIEVNGGNEHSRGNNGRIEETEPNGMGRQNERVEEQSTQYNIQRTDLHLNQQNSEQEKAVTTNDSAAFSDFQKINKINELLEQAKLLYAEISPDKKTSTQNFEELLSSAILETKKVADTVKNAEPQKEDKQLTANEQPTSEKTTSADKQQNNNIIGNTPYRYIGKKTYRKLEYEAATAIAKEFDKAELKYSGKVNNDNTITLTFSGNDINTANKIILDVQTKIKEREQADKNSTLSKEEIEIARRTNLVNYLGSRGVELKQVGKEYTMKEHDSMRISEYKFYWNSQNTGGNAVDFCMKYFGMDFYSAVNELLEYNGYHKDILASSTKSKVTPSVPQYELAEKEPEEPHNPLPYPLDEKTNRVYAYLTKTRGLDSDVVNKFISEGIISQDKNGNAVFKIFDENGELSGAEINGTVTGARYKQITERGGNGFTIKPDKDVEPNKIIFFESSIDLLSFYNLKINEKDSGIDKAVLVSMGGIKDKVVNTSLERYEKQYNKKLDVVISSDNDEAGINFSEKMLNNNKDKSFTSYSVANDHAFEKYTDKKIKDWNDLLLAENEYKELHPKIINAAENIVIEQSQLEKTVEKINALAVNIIKATESENTAKTDEEKATAHNDVNKYWEDYVGSITDICTVFEDMQNKEIISDEQYKIATDTLTAFSDAIDNYVANASEFALKLQISGNIIELVSDKVNFNENHSETKENTETSEIIDFYHIYQIKDDEQYNGIRFSSSQEMKNNGIQVNISDYNLIYSGNLKDIEGTSFEEKLNTIYNKFNINKPEDFTGHSLSVSDVITVGNEETENAYFVDKFGFTDMPEFFSEIDKNAVKKIEETENLPQQDKLQESDKYNLILDDEPQPVLNKDITYPEITKDMYDIENAKISFGIVTVNIETSKGLLERLADYGAKQDETSLDKVQLIADNKSWNKLVIPDKYGNKTNNVPIADILTETELKVAQNIIDNFLPQEHKKEPVNFKITNTEVEKLSAKEKYRNNVSAIKALKSIENENRTATHEEQEILSKYIGWGGLSDAFDENKTAWKDEYSELKELLTPVEYNAARSSTLNAHYTSPTVINAMYKALENIGFSGGKILEPSMGNGRFFGCIPDTLSDNTKLYGVELDNLTGRMAKQLYPNANIQIKGFEKTNFPSNSFDVAIGNVPFGNYRVNDKDFKENDLIHDYFFKKSLDKVRQGGVVAFITSKGTLDKQDNTVRKYIAERADLLGAVRLPNNAFSEANTEVTSDIIFLQKRDVPLDFTKDEIPSWVNLSTDKNGIEMNSYFTENPQMILGEMTEVSGRFGMETTCKPIDNADFSKQLVAAVGNIKGEVSKDNVTEEIQETSENLKNIIPENYRNFCYAVINDKIYFRENDLMSEEKVDGKKAERIKGMVEISGILQKLIEYQRDNHSDDEIINQQEKLNNVYDKFTSEYGLLSDKQNKSLFVKDDTAQLIFSLENINQKGELESKADIFTKRTIVPYIPVTNVDTSSEALAVSISEKAKVDLDFMSQLCSKPKDEIIEDLKGVIFENPITKQYENADEYLSGDVRHKLEIAELYAKEEDKYAINVKSLTQVQPEDLKPSEISAQLGSTWIPTKYFQQFTYELLDTPKRCQANYILRDNGKNPFASGTSADNQTIMVSYDIRSATYGISNKNSYSADKNNVKATKTYGTDRINAYKIIEDTLNLKTVKIYDYKENQDGKPTPVLNEKETLLAQEKQNQIKQKFKEWVFDDYDRTNDLCEIYNKKFNSVRPREYDGSHITFGGMNPEIKLREHQVNAIAHTLYGGNTLLAHSVGAGKTFEICASAMESKRLGLCSKSLIVVPKHIVNQFAKEFLQLYPAANILVPNEKDFSKSNREKFCSRIATGNYDAIILSHSQFEKIPLSAERQATYIENEIKDIVTDIFAMKAERNTGFSIKQLEATKKQLEVKLEKLNNNDKRDTTICFEDLGIDKLFVDEAHSYKNKFFSTKIGRNVAGINASSVSQRATDLDMKCRYLDEKTGSKGCVFATGTPLSNSMTELYTMQSYLQRDELKKRGLTHFDAWASTFGETKLAMELAPEGTGFQMKNRFSNFFNLPELMTMFKEIADIKTSDMLNLPVPKPNFNTIVTEPSDYQKEMVLGLAERADKIRKRDVSNTVDNMLSVTNDGRKLALDQRLMNNMLPDNPNSKVNTCINNVYDIWAKTADKKSTQMIFCDLSTPHFDGKFNVYDDIKDKLAAKGVPKNQIAYIHDCKTDEQKQALFTKVRNGEVRVLIGSTEKMGVGTNCQQKLKAVHHIDCPYRPSDLEQRNGRIIRQGNENPEVDIFNYVTAGTFDSYLYQLIENKQRFISQIMTSKSPVRSAEDIDESVLSYAQIKALASGNPKIEQKMNLEVEVTRLRTLFSAYQENKRTLQNLISNVCPQDIKKYTEQIEGLKADIKQSELTKSSEFTEMTVLGTSYTDKKEAVQSFMNSFKGLSVSDIGSKNIGNYRGFDMSVSFDRYTSLYYLTLKNSLSYKIDLGSDAYGNLTRIDNLLNSTLSKKLENAVTALSVSERQLASAKEDVNKPFPQANELKEKEELLSQLNIELSSDSKEVSTSPKEQEKTVKSNDEREL